MPHKPQACLCFLWKLLLALSHCPDQTKIMYSPAETQPQVSNPISMIQVTSHLMKIIRPVPPNTASPCPELFIHKEAQPSILPSDNSTPLIQLFGNSSSPNITNGSDESRVSHPSGYSDLSRDNHKDEQPISLVTMVGPGMTQAGPRGSFPIDFSK